MRKNVAERIHVSIESMYHRDQFDDWLAGGRIEINGRTYYWSAQDSNYGFGWEMEPVNDDDWIDISEDQFEKIASLVRGCLKEYRVDYEFQF